MPVSTNHLTVEPALIFPIRLFVNRELFAPLLQGAMIVQWSQILFLHQGLPAPVSSLGKQFLLLVISPKAYISSLLAVVFLLALPQKWQSAHTSTYPSLPSHTQFFLQAQHQHGQHSPVSRRQPTNLASQFFCCSKQKSKHREWSSNTLKKKTPSSLPTPDQHRRVPQEYLRD